MVIFGSGEKEQKGDLTWFLFNKKWAAYNIGIFTRPIDWYKLNMYTPEVEKAMFNFFLTIP